VRYSWKWLLTLNFRIATPLNIKNAKVAIMVLPYFGMIKARGANFQQIGHKKVEPLWELSFRLHFQTHPKMNHDILGLLDKSKTPGRCGFPLANPHSGESRDFASSLIVPIF
jgi:hypothetical protein